MDQDHHPLAARWREEAQLLRRCGAHEAATTREACADELDAYERERGLQPLTLTQASAESGRHKDTIARYIDEGELENVGKKGSPLVRRGDLLAKLTKPSPRKKITPTTSSGPQLVQAALAEQGILPAES